MQIASSVEVAVPTVVLKYLHLLVGESLAVADRHVALDVADGAHAWDDGRDCRMAQDVAERYLGYLILARPELGDDGQHAVVDLLFAPVSEVVVAEISLFEGGIGGDSARQGALVEGYPDYDADVVFLAGWQETVLRTLVEDVVDHLHRIHRAGLDEPHRVRRLVIVYGDAESVDLAFPLQVLDRLEPIPITDPVVLPDMELLHVDGFQSEVGEALLRTLPDVISWEYFFRGDALRSRPDSILRRNLGGDVDSLVPLCDQLPYEPLAVSLPVCQGRIYEIETEVYGPVQGPQRFLVLRAEPGVASDAPGPVAYLRDLQARPSERSVVHAASMSSACRMVTLLVTTSGSSRNRQAYIMLACRGRYKGCVYSTSAARRWSSGSGSFWRGW